MRFCRNRKKVLRVRAQWALREEYTKVMEGVSPGRAFQAVVGLVLSLM